jgi:hypothetical protein
LDEQFLDKNFIIQMKILSNHTFNIKQIYKLNVVTLTSFFKYQNELETMSYPIRISYIDHITRFFNNNQLTHQYFK